MRATKENLKITLDEFDYGFPQELIAMSPAAPRDAARLMVYERKSKKKINDRFANLGKYLPSRSVIVLNETKVLPARFKAVKPTGGQAQLLYVKTEAPFVYVMSDKKLQIGSQIKSGKYTLKVVKKLGSQYQLEPHFAIDLVAKLLQERGTMPLPPYIKSCPLSEAKIKREYQTIFAKNRGSVAAPTASLHFTKELLKEIEASFDVVKLTLHVNLGTFAPVQQENLSQNKLHSELYEISQSNARLLNKAKKAGRPIIAVGTTSLRALESAQRVGQLTELAGQTSLFIRPGYKFGFVDGLITNFHVPRSSLLMLVAALVGRKKLLELYSLAIKKKYRLFSFGDAMLIK